MSFWKQLPPLTRIYLAILGYLLVLLGILIFIRASDLPVGTQIVQAILFSTDESADGQATPQGSLTPSAPVPGLPPGTPWLRAIARAMVRSGPGATFEAPAMLEVGQVFPVVGVSADGQWWAIQAPELAGGKGWVAANEVIVENAANVPVDSTGTTPVVPTEMLPVAQAITVVNIRSGPNLESNVIGGLENGQTSEIVGKSEDGYWFAVKLPNDLERFGWVARDYVVARNAEGVPVLSESPVAVGSNATIAPGAPYLTAVWEVNIRAGPGQEYAVLGSLKQGAAAEIVGKSADGAWWAIQYDAAENGKGWVASDFVEAVNGDSAPVLK